MPSLLLGGPLTLWLWAVPALLALPLGVPLCLLPLPLMLRLLLGTATSALLLTVALHLPPVGRPGLRGSLLPRTLLLGVPLLGRVPRLPLRLLLRATALLSLPLLMSVCLGRLLTCRPAMPLCLPGTLYLRALPPALTLLLRRALLAPHLLAMALRLPAPVLLASALDVRRALLAVLRPRWGGLPLGMLLMRPCLPALCGASLPRPHHVGPATTLMCTGRPHRTIGVVDVLVAHTIQLREGHLGGVARLGLVSRLLLGHTTNLVAVEHDRPLHAVLSRVILAGRGCSGVHPLPLLRALATERVRACVAQPLRTVLLRAAVVALCHESPPERRDVRR